MIITASTPQRISGYISVQFSLFILGWTWVCFSSRHACKYVYLHASTRWEEKLYCFQAHANCTQGEAWAASARRLFAATCQNFRPTAKSLVNHPPPPQHTCSTSFNSSPRAVCASENKNIVATCLGLTVDNKRTAKYGRVNVNTILYASALIADQCRFATSSCLVIQMTRFMVQWSCIKIASLILT